MSSLTDAILKEKVEQGIQILDREGIDLWMTFVRESSTIHDPALDLICGMNLTWPSALILTRTGEKTAIVGTLEVEALKTKGVYDPIVGYDTSVKEPLLEALERIQPQSIAVNFSENNLMADGLTHGLYLTLEKYLADTPYLDQFVSSDAVVSSLRGIKSATEIECLRKAIRTTEEIFEGFGKTVRPGLTEKEAAEFYHGELDRRGLEPAWDRDHCPGVTAGPDSPFGHGGPQDYTVERGQTIGVDFGVKEDGYCADLQRLWYILGEGETAPPEAVIKAFDAIRGTIETAQKLVKPGVLGHVIDTAAREYLKKHGFDEYPHALGHQIGRSCHDGAALIGPRWEKYGDLTSRPLEPGNVFTLELEVHVPQGLVSLEEDILITENGCEYLSTPQTEVWVVG
jgi:Xaa-Pro aminopeptidase